MFHDDMFLCIVTYLIWLLGTFGVVVVLYTVFIFEENCWAYKPFVMKSGETECLRRGEGLLSGSKLGTKQVLLY